MSPSRMFILAGTVACSVLSISAAKAETYVSRSYTTDPNGGVVVEQTTSTYEPSPATVTTTTVTKSYDPPYRYGSDEEDFIPDPERKGTYAMGEDNQGNNTLRYENRTHDGFNN